jgi:predicted ATPase
MSFVCLLWQSPVSETLSAPKALSFSAIQLFVERATANLNEFELTGANTATVADICRKLDGVPLAIELAAACVDAFGVHELARRLGDRFRLPTHGDQPALPQHRALRATHEWSYEHLPQAERVVLQRLSIFAGCFELDAAVAVAASAVRTPM